MRQTKRFPKSLFVALTITALMVSMFSLSSPVFARPPPPTSYVYIGTDKTFTTADRGDKGESRWGLSFIPVTYNGYRFAYREATAFAMGSVLIFGWGGCESWAWVGKYFYATGGGSQAANIRMEGHIYGYLGAVAAASATVDIKLIVKDINTGAIWSTTIKHKSVSGPLQDVWINEDFNRAIVVVLQSYRYYYVYVKVTCSSSLTGVGWSVADFEYQDGESPTGYARYNKIVIDF